MDLYPQRRIGLFEYHGYLRSGYGLNSVGGQQVAFEAPGTEVKYRLGNEAETYGEFIFVNNWLNPDEGRDKAWLRAEIMIEANTSNSENYANFPHGIGDDQFRLREAFVQAGNVSGEWQPNAKFWAGERYYRRQHIDIDDFYPLDMSGYGAGVEDFNVGIGKVAAAFISTARPDIVTQNGVLARSNIDVRLYDLKAPAGLWAVWFDYATSKGGTTSTGTIVPTTDGYALGFRHQRLEWHGGYHTFSILYGTGAVSNFSSGGSGTTIPDPTLYINQSKRLLITEQLVFQPNDRFGIMPIFVYQRTKDGNPKDGWNHWVSFGARPEIFFTNHISLAVEAGFDQTHRGMYQYDGWLRKVTIAPQIGAGRKFFSRPVLRAFVNYFGLPEIAAFSAKTASGYVAFYWGGAMIGRFIGAPLLQRFKPVYLLALCAVAAAVLVAASMLTHGHAAMWTILAVGFFNSIMFPTIFSLGEAELGTLSGKGSGLLNMAIVGDAILPVIQGVIADRVGIHHAFVLPVICYLYILFYALSGSKPNSLRFSSR